MLSALYEQYPGESSVLLRYARVALRTGGASAAPEACAAAGAAAALLQAQGRPREAAQALRMCPLGPEAAVEAGREPPAGLARGSKCDALAAAALAAAGAARSDAERAQVGTAFVTGDGPGCRGTKTYVEVVSHLQNADPYNPHLHAEWARLLRAMPARDVEAAQHMAFAVSVWEQAAREARRAPQGQAAARLAAAARAEMGSWEGVRAGPRSVAQLANSQLKSV